MALLYTLIILTLNLIGTLASEPACTPQFTCIANDPKSFVLNGAKLRCPKEFICNKYTSDCEPCIKPSGGNCGFTCTDDTTGKLTIEPKQAFVSQDFQCNQGQVCNQKYVDSCAPCIDPICEPTWKCDPNTETTGIDNNVAFKCIPGQVCNKEPTKLCTRCIDDPTVKYPPNCNDGKVQTKPCRPGPPGSGIYYNCRKSGNGYDYEVKSCRDIAKDSCRSIENLCY